MKLFVPRFSIIATLIVLVDVFCFEAQAGKDYEWDGNSATDANDWDDNDNWGDDPGTSWFTDNYGITGGDYTAGEHPIVDATTTWEDIDNVLVINSALLEIQGNTMNITNNLAVINRSRVEVTGGTVNISENLSVYDDASTFYVDGGDINITQDIVFSNNTDPEPDGSNQGAPIVQLESGTIDCRNIIFDNETGDTAPKLIINGGTLTVSTDVFSGDILSEVVDGLGTPVNIEINGGSLIIEGDLLMTDGDDILTMTNGNLEVKGDWTNNGTYNITGGTVTINGNSLQTITNDVTPTFYDLVIDNSGANVESSRDIMISNALILTNGALDMNNNTLSITSTSTSAITFTNGYILNDETSEGNATTVSWTLSSSGTYIFPFSLDGATDIPFILETTSGSGTISVSTYTTAADNTPFPTGVTNVNRRLKGLPVVNVDNSENTVDRFWVVNSSGGVTANVTFTAAPAEVGSIAELKAQRWNGTTWEKPIDGQGSGSASATVPGVSSFSPWTLSGNDKPLPVEMLFFEAMKTSEGVVLKWATATEIENEKFDIERSDDGNDFFKIGEVRGNGDSKERIDYQYIDFHTSSSNSPSLYYRLKQIDYDGDSEYSNIKSIVRNNGIEKAVDIVVTPNPFVRTLAIELVAPQNEEVAVSVYSLSGHLIYFGRQTIMKGLNRIQLTNLEGTAPGTYILKIAGSSTNFAEKRIVKQ